MRPSTQTTQTDVRTTLAGIAAGYSESLKFETRRRIIASAMQGVQSRKEARPAFLPTAFLPKALATAAILVVMLLPAFQLHRSGQLDSATPIRDLQVSTQGSQVVLTWHDGNQPRKVIKATSREELPRLSQADGVAVTGERWVDNQADDTN